MSNAELVYAAVVLFVGLPASVKNGTAAALVICYLFMQGSYYGLHFVYPPSVLVLADCTVIAVIYCKRPAHDLYPYRDGKAQLAAFWFELSYWDRLIIGLFALGWAFYALAADPWWPLYWISLAQLIAAAFEAYETYRSTHNAGTAAPDSSAGLEFRWTRGRERYGGC